MKYREASAQPLSTDLLADLYDESQRRYLFQVSEPLPRFGLKSGDVLIGSSSHPKINDLVACSLPDNHSCLAIGRFIARIGKRVALEDVTGVITIIMINSIVTVEHIG